MLISNGVNVPDSPHLAPRLDALTEVLFQNGDAGPDLHVPERWQQSYDRLRALNEEALCVQDLVQDPRALATLHEWTSVVDGARPWPASTTTSSSAASSTTRCRPAATWPSSPH